MKSTPRESLITLVSRDRIADRVRELGRSIHADYEGRDLVIVGVLTGAFVFVADLIRALHLPVTVDFVGLASYGASTEPSGAVTVTKPLTVPLAGKDVLVVEDVLDTGRSMKTLLGYLETLAPASLRLCVLVDKRERRREAIHADYVGFSIVEGFVVGYGIDHDGRWRELPEICRVATEHGV